MTEQKPVAKGAVERKVKVMSALSLVAMLAAGLAVDYVSILPDWSESLVGASLAGLVTFLGGYYSRTDPDALSPSTIAAVQEWLRVHLPRPPRM